MHIDSGVWQTILWGFYVGLGFTVAGLIVGAIVAGIKRLLK